MDHILEAVQPYGMLTAGALFGAGWWCWCDVSERRGLGIERDMGGVCLGGGRGEVVKGLITHHEAGILQQCDAV